jgi:hypothetical protein
MNQFLNRLRDCAENGSLSTSDLAYWFDVPYPSMWAWLHGKRAGGDRGSYVQRFEQLTPLLANLEALILQEGRLPVPFELNRKNAKRADFIRKLRDANSARISASRPARRRGLLRSSAAG